MLAFLHCSHHLQTHEHTHRKHIRLNTHQIYYVQVMQYSQNSFCLLLMEEHIERKSKGCFILCLSLDCVYTFFFFFLKLLLLWI